MICAATFVATTKCHLIAVPSRQCCGIFVISLCRDKARCLGVVTLLIVTRRCFARFSHPRLSSVEEMKEKLLQLLLTSSQSMLMDTGCPVEKVCRLPLSLSTCSVVGCCSHRVTGQLYILA